MIVTIGNNKGGVGKTMTTITLGAYLARKGLKVLVIDFDGQRNATLTVIPELDQETAASKTVMSWLQKKTSFDETIRKDVPGWGFDLIPSSITLVEFEVNFPVLTEFVLKQALEDIMNDNRYDVILIDTAPSNGALIRNALMASDEILMVSTGHRESVMEGISQIQLIINMVHSSRAYNPNLKTDGVLLTMVQRQFKSSLEEQVAARTYLEQEGKYVYNTYIRHSPVVGKLSYYHKEICQAVPNNIVSKDYAQFCEEWIARHGI